jgi:1,4-alpha-glucan branching enzyme
VVSIEEDGRILFAVSIPGARSVEIVGAFGGWHDERHGMAPSVDGTWTARLDPGPGSFLFRYLVNGREWVVDEEAHGLVVAADGWEKSRVYRPPVDPSPDAMAA